MKSQLNPYRRDPCADARPAGDPGATASDRAGNPGSVLYSLSFMEIAGGGGPLTARAAANIAEWSTYLPKDCVEAMIRDGWHLTV